MRQVGVVMAALGQTVLKMVIGAEKTGVADGIRITMGGKMVLERPPIAETIATCVTTIAGQPPQVTVIRKNVIKTFEIVSVN